jgi:hypothetical protein
MEFLTVRYWMLKHTASSFSGDIGLSLMCIVNDKNERSDPEALSNKMPRRVFYPTFGIVIVGFCLIIIFANPRGSWPQDICAAFSGVLERACNEPLICPL